MTIAFRAAGTAATGAPPTVVGASSTVSGTSTVTPTIPAGSTTNDILLIFVHSSNETGLSAPSGYAEVTNSPQGTGTAATAGSAGLQIFWKRHSGSESNPTVGDSGNHTVAAMLSVRGCVTSGNPWDVTAGDVASSASATVTFPAVTTTKDNCLIVLTVSNATDSNTAQDNGSPAKGNMLYNHENKINGNTNSGTGGGLCVYTSHMGTAGGIGTVTEALVSSSKQARHTMALKPANVCTPTLPSGHTTDDFLLLIASAPGNTVTGPSGWTAIDVSPAIVTGGNVGLYPNAGIWVWWKKDNGSETDPTVVFHETGSSAMGSAIIAQVFAFTGVDTTSPIDATASATTSGGGTSGTAPAVTTVAANAMVLAMLAFSANSTSTNVTASGQSNGALVSVTEGGDQYTKGNSSSDSGEGFSLAYGIKSAAGSTGTTSFTLSSSCSSQAKITISLKPATGSTTITAAQGTFTETGVAAGLAFGHVVTAAKGTFTETGVAAVLTYGHPMAAATGTFTLTGKAVILDEGHVLTGTKGTFTLSGVAASLVHNYPLTAAQGSFTETGVVAALTYGHPMAAAQGSYTLTGVAAALKDARVLPAAAGAFTLTGNAAGLVRGRMLTSAVGSFTLTGQAAVLDYGRVVTAARGTFSLTGISTALKAGRVVTAAQGTFTLAGKTATLARGYLCTAANGAFSLAGVNGSGGAAWDISAASYGGKSYNASSFLSNAYGFFIKPDGAKVYNASYNNTIYQSSLSTAWDITTASYDSKSFDTSSQTTNITGVFFSSDGTKMYVADYRDTKKVFEYTLSAAWDVSTASYSGKSSDLSTEISAITSIFFKDDGSKLYVGDEDYDIIFEYTLSTPWDISTANYGGISVNIDSTLHASIEQIYIRADGTKLITATYPTKIFSFTLTTPWDISSAVYDGIMIDTAAQTSSGGTDGITGLSFRDNGNTFYVIAYDVDTFFEYDIAQGTQLRADRRSAESAGAFTLTGNTAFLDDNHILIAATGSFTETGISAGLTAARRLPAAAGAFILTGSAASLVAQRDMVAAAGTCALTGNAAGLRVGRMIAAAAGTFGLGGNAASLIASRDISPAAGLFAVAGENAEMIVGRGVPADVGVYSLVGHNVVLTYIRANSMAAAVQAFALVGVSADLTAARLPAIELSGILAGLAEAEGYVPSLGELSGQLNTEIDLP